jgi:hypothetical protein
LLEVTGDVSEKDRAEIERIMREKSSGDRD